MRTAEEKAEAIARLELNKTKCRRLTTFGDDNHLRIDAMIRVIKEDLNDNDCYNEFEDNDCISEALSAYEYMQGQCEVEDLLYPEY